MSRIENARVKFTSAEKSELSTQARLHAEQEEEDDEDSESELDEQTGTGSAPPDGTSPARRKKRARTA